jgi:hypothetical protein
LVEVPPHALVAFTNRRFILQDGSLLKGRLLQETPSVTTQFGLQQVPRTALKKVRTAPVVRLGAVPSKAEPSPAVTPRVYRGGGWGTFAGNCRSLDRNYNAPSQRLAGLGFRVLREGW